VFISALVDGGDTDGDAMAYVHAGRAALRMPVGCNPAMVCAGLLPDPSVQLQVAVSVAVQGCGMLGLMEQEGLLPAGQEGSNGLVH
jgi:hypothetical protein